MILTTEQREQFLRWLECEAESDRAIINQMGILREMPESLLGRRKRELAAKLIVADILRNTSSETL